MGGEDKTKLQNQNTSLIQISLPLKTILSPALQPLNNFPIGEVMERKKDEALVILQDSIYKAAEVVVSTSDFTKLKKSLKKEFHARR